MPWTNGMAVSNLGGENSKAINFFKVTDVTLDMCDVRDQGGKVSLIKDHQRAREGMILNRTTQAHLLLILDNVCSNFSCGKAIYKDPKHVKNDERASGMN